LKHWPSSFIQIYRRRIPRAASQKYLAFANSFEMKQKSQTNRRQRGRKLHSGPKGSHFDLLSLFTKLNHQYFDGKLKEIKLGWSLKKSRRILGHFDPSHHSITISRVFDEPRVPEAIVSMCFTTKCSMPPPPILQISIAESGIPEFKIREKEFPDYKYAND
jgi:hypothetical protein